MKQKTPRPSPAWLLPVSLKKPDSSRFYVLAMKNLKVTLISVGVVVLLAVAVVASIFVPRWLAGPQGKTEEVLIVNQGAFRIQGYELFYDVSEQVEAIDVKLGAYPTELDIREEKECRSLIARRADLVAEYNAASRAERTTGQWRADDLPPELSHDSPRAC